MAEPVKTGLLWDPVDHFDGHIGQVITASEWVFDCDIEISRVTEDVRGHISTGHETICKITTGSSVLYIDDQPAAIQGSQVSCEGIVRAQAQVAYAEP